LLCGAENGGDGAPRGGSHFYARNPGGAAGVVSLTVTTTSRAVDEVLCRVFEGADRDRDPERPL
jgi:hypothetical protein